LIFGSSPDDLDDPDDPDDPDDRRELELELELERNLTTECDLNFRDLESKVLADATRPKLKLWTPVRQHIDLKVV